MDEIEQNLSTCLKECDHTKTCNLDEKGFELIAKGNQNVIHALNHEMSELAHTMRHDIRNFVAAIEGYAYLLKDDFDASYLDRISKNSTNINKLIDRALKIIDSGLKADKKEKVDLNNVISKIKTKFNEKNFSVSNLIEVQGDEFKITELISIITENAFVHGKASEVKFLGKNDDTSYNLKIINKGSPVPEKIVNELFSKVNSLKENSGISLFVAKKICQSLGWKISLNQEVSNETCFEIKIPLWSIV